MDRLFRCCVQRVNGLWNAASASGPSQETMPDYVSFLEAASLMRRLQLRRGSGLVYELTDEGYVLKVRFGQRDALTKDVARLKELLDLSPALNEFTVQGNVAGEPGTSISVLPRSLMSIMVYLSLAVDVPPADLQAGRVRTTRNEEGDPFDWALVTAGLFRVRTSSSAPADAFVRVRYRGSWFYIDDSDLDSKATFTLLEHLFNLQAGEGKAAAPLLTLPVGR